MHANTINVSVQICRYGRVGSPQNALPSRGANNVAMKPVKGNCACSDGPQRAGTCDGYGAWVSHISASIRSAIFWAGSRSWAMVQSAA